MARVLHIEDDQRNRLLVRKLLTWPRGTRSSTRPTGVEGVRLALERAPRPRARRPQHPGPRRLRGHAASADRGQRSRACPSWPSPPRAIGRRASPWAATASSRSPSTRGSSPRRSGGYLRGFTRARASSPTPPASGSACRAGASWPTSKRRSRSSAVGERAAPRARPPARAEFYRNMSHELATPLTPIVGYLKHARRRRAR
jgi:signal transduction histidine kinase